MQIRTNLDTLDYVIYGAVGFRRATRQITRIWFIFRSCFFSMGYDGLVKTCVIVV